MAIQRMDHVGIVVEDLAAAIDFFVELGLTPIGQASLGGPWVDRIIGLEGVRSDIAMLETPDGRARLELSKFHSPASPVDEAPGPVNALGIRHLSFTVDDIETVVARLRARGVEPVGEVERYEDSYLLCYVRGPEGIFVELAEELG